MRLFIEMHGDSRFTELLKPDPKKPSVEAENLNRTTINRAGYRRGLDLDGGLPTKWEFLIFPEVWKSEICKGIDPALAAKALADAEYLLKGDGTNFARKQHIPGLGKTRCYTIGSSILQGDV